jgi:hypothetical protein
MQLVCVVKSCSAEARHIVSSSKRNAGYPTCTPHLGDVSRIVVGYYHGRLIVALIVPKHRVSSMEVKALTSRRQHHLAS